MFERVALIGLGLIGSSLAHAIKRGRLAETIAGYDASETVRKRAAQLELAAIAPSPALVVKDSDLVILCSPIGSYKELAAEFAPHLRPGAILTDVGSVKSAVLKDVTPFVPKDVHFLPAHPIAGTEQSGPDAGFPSLFDRRWCIITPPPGADGAALTRLKQFWEKCGSQVDVMDAGHHDLVLAMTSHVPHLIAYNIVGTAHDLEKVAETEVIKFSAGGFRDFTRIAASDPTMWRDVFLNNRDAVLEVLGRFNEDLSLLQRAIRDGNGQFLFDLFSRTRAIRRSIIDIGQDSAAPNFGRDRSDVQKK
jgi:cyclohexadieny/prephenate dehydrogenase